MWPKTRVARNQGGRLPWQGCYPLCGHLFYRLFLRSQYNDVTAKKPQISEKLRLGTSASSTTTTPSNDYNLALQTLEWELEVHKTHFVQVLSLSISVNQVISQQIIIPMTLTSVLWWPREGRTNIYWEVKPLFKQHNSQHFGNTSISLNLQSNFSIYKS